MTMVIANREMEAAWEEEAVGWVDQSERYEKVGVRQWAALMAAVAVDRRDQVLDVGCGTGHSTREMARLAAEGGALGIDISRRMIEHARQLAQAEGLTNARFEHGDAQVHPFEPATFDLAISVFGGMFFNDPVAAFANIGRSLKPGGHLAMLAWQELGKNEWLTALRRTLAFGRPLPEPPVGAPGPFGLADPDRTRAVLQEAGLVSVDLESLEEPMVLGDAEEALAFLEGLGITRGLMEGLDEASAAAGADGLRRLVAENETAGGVLLGTSAWLITARRPARQP